MLRKQWLAMAMIVFLVELWVLLTSSFMGASQPISILLILVHQLIFWMIIFFLFARIGLLGLCAFFFFSSCVSGSLPPIDPTVWYGTGAAFHVIIASVIALLAFYVSLGGRSLLGKGVVPES